MHLGTQQYFRFGDAQEKSPETTVFLVSVVACSWSFEMCVRVILAIVMVVSKRCECKKKRTHRNGLLRVGDERKK